MSSIFTAPVEVLTQAYATGEETPTGIVAALEERTADIDPKINSVARSMFEEARVAAAESSERWRRGNALGALDGVPVTVKESVDVRGTATFFGARGRRELPPVELDAPLVARLRAAGAILVAKTTMPDLGMLISGDSSLYGTTRNPWDLTKTPGGSSAGAAAGVAAGLAYVAVGTDLAGSVRIPAAYCGLVGVKPTQGVIGHLPSSPVRSPGPLARNVADAKTLLSVIRGFDAGDAFSHHCVEAFEDASELVLGGVRVGILLAPDGAMEPDLAVIQAVADVADLLKERGAIVETIAPPLSYADFQALDRTFRLRAWSEIADLSPQEDGAAVLSVLEAWAKSSAEYSAEEHYRDLSAVGRASARFSAALESFDLVLSPVLPHVSAEATIDAVDADAPMAHGRMAGWVNQTGRPALSMPAAMEGGMPVGIQLIGGRFQDALVLQAASAVEKELGLALEWPELTDARPMRVDGGLPPTLSRS